MQWCVQRGSAAPSPVGQPDLEVACQRGRVDHLDMHGPPHQSGLLVPGIRSHCLGLEDQHARPRQGAICNDDDDEAWMDG